MAATRGIEAKHEYSQQALLRDTRPLGTRMAETAGDPRYAAYVFGVVSLLVTLIRPISFLSDVLLLIGIPYFVAVFRRQRPLPFRWPAHLGGVDPGNIDPDTRKARPASGIEFIGNLKGTGEQVWDSDDDARTHKLIIGTTGSGKTEKLKSFCTNALTWASGFLYIDGKADTKLWHNLVSLARRFGRDDDLLLINYLADPKKVGSVSNTINPLANGSVNNVIQLIVSMMSDAGTDGMWKDRAIALINAVVPAQIWLRDNAGLLLDISVIRENLQLKNVIRLARDETIPLELRVPIDAYLKGLPGWDDDAFNDEGEERPSNDPQKPRDTNDTRLQHGFLEMQFVRLLGSLADTYGQIFKSQLADVDMRDVVLNNRLLVTLLPALKTSPDELANLGRIVLASLREMLGDALGDQVEGDVEEAINNRPTNAPVPVLGIFDELGAFIVPGTGTMFAQARSLGVSLIAATQEIPGLRERVAEEADKVIGNCTQLYMMLVSEPGATRELFEKKVGDARVTMTAGFTATTGVMAQTYYDRQDAAIEKTLRADWVDVIAQDTGESHLIFRDKIIRVRAFYSPPRNVPYLRVHRFLQVLPPSANAVEQPIPGRGRGPMREAIAREVGALLEKIKAPDWTAAGVAGAIPPMPEVEIMAGSFGAAMRAGLNFVECGCVAVAALAQPLAANVDAMKAALAPVPVQAASMPARPAPPLGQLASLAELAARVGVTGPEPTAGEPHVIDAGAIPAAEAPREVLARPRTRFAGDVNGYWKSMAEQLVAGLCASIDAVAADEKAGAPAGLVAAPPAAVATPEPVAVAPVPVAAAAVSSEPGEPAGPVDPAPAIAEDDHEAGDEAAEEPATEEAVVDRAGPGVQGEPVRKGDSVLGTVEADRKVQASLATLERHLGASAGAAEQAAETVVSELGASTVYPDPPPPPRLPAARVADIIAGIYEGVELPSRTRPGRSST